MGVVFRARDQKLGREVALKFLSPHLLADETARSRLVREAQAAAALDHANIASVYDVGEMPDGQLYIAMAYYVGETLAERIARGPLDPEAAVDLGVQIAHGLGAAHRAGIVHRDVKPANVMLVPDAGAAGGVCAKVLDFGIAKVEDGDLTLPGESLGTALYMSPEQLRGEPVDARGDVWAVGVLLYEMLTGRRPFGGTYAAAIGYAVLHEEPNPPSTSRDGLPAGLDEVVRRCLAKDPADRYASMEALADALARVGHDVARPEADSLSIPASEPPRGGLARSGRMPLVAGVVALLIAIGAVLAWGGLRSGSDTEEVPRLVVLPFQGADAGPLSEGLVEVITSKLSRLAPLDGRIRIVPASEIEPGMTPREARDRFGVSLVVDGLVQVEGNRVRVTLTLSDVSEEPSEQLGTGEVDDTSGSAFALQDAAVLELAGLLRVEIGTEVQADLAAGGTDDPEANRLYLRGLGELRNHQSADDLGRARSLFQEALALDPSFTLALAALAEAEWETYRTTSDVTWADRAITTAERALALDDGIASVHAVLGTIHGGRGAYDLALASLERARTLDSRDPEIVRQLARVYASQGRTAEATTAFREAIALAPDFWRPYNSFGVFYLNEGKAGAAVEQFQRGLDVDPVNLSLLYNLGVAEWQEGDLEASRQTMTRVVRLDPEHASATASLATVAFSLGDYAAAIEAGERAVALLPDDYDVRYGLAEARRWSPGQRARAADDYRAALGLAREHLAVGRTPSVLITMAGAFAGLGEADSARAVLAEVERLLSPADAGVRDAYQIGVAYEAIGERPRALVWLRSALERGFGHAQAERSPWLADLRTTSSFRSLLSP